MTPADLKAWRSAKGWTQARFAREVGISERAVLFYEKPGSTVPRYVYLSTVALDARPKLISS